MTPIKGSDSRLPRKSRAPAPAVVSPAAYSTIPGTPTTTVGFYLMLAYLFLAFSRVLDVFVPGLRAPVVFFVCMSILTVMSGTALRFLEASIGKWLLAFSLWTVIAVPFSTWPSGSAPYLIDIFRSFVFAAIILGVTIDMSRVHKLLRMVAYSILAGGVMSLIYGQVSYGRLTLAEGTLGDPNQFAMTLLFGLPFWLWISSSMAFPFRIVPYVCIVPIFIGFLKAGSRGAEIGFLAFCAVLFWQTRRALKPLFLLGVIVVSVVSIAMLPDYLKQRYFTFFSADTAQVSSERDRELLEGADVGSSQVRLTLLLDSIEMTAKHPFFGVGAGQFAYQDWLARHNAGLGIVYNVTHNTYTQVSSELGIPGLILFLGVLASCFRALRSVTELKSSPLYRLPPQVIDTSQTLFLGLVVLCVCGFFLSLAFGSLFFVLSAIIAVFHRAVQDALPGWRVAPAGANTLSAPGISPRPRPAFAGPGFGRRLSP